MMKEKKTAGRLKKQLAERVERISYYEALLNALQCIISVGDVSEETLPAAREIADALSAYCESDDWKRDYAADEAGLLPQDLRRGVLSEDGIYNALEAYAAWLEKPFGATEESR